MGGNKVKEKEESPSELRCYSLSQQTLLINPCFFFFLSLMAVSVKISKWLIANQNLKVKRGKSNGTTFRTAIKRSKLWVFILCLKHKPGLKIIAESEWSKVGGGGKFLEWSGKSKWDCFRTKSIWMSKIGDNYIWTRFPLEYTLFVRLFQLADLFLVAGLSLIQFKVFLFNERALYTRWTLK